MDQVIGDDELDRQLREAAPYIDDDGFTKRVLKQLPAQSAPARLRGVILILTAILASVVAYVVSGGGHFVIDYLAQLFQLPMQWLLVLSFTAGIVIGGLGLAAAVFKAREPVLISR
jgi:hypothetical protein